MTAPAWATNIESIDNALWTNIDDDPERLEDAWQRLFSEPYNAKAAADTFSDLGFWGARAVLRLFPGGRIALTVEGWGSFIYRAPANAQCACSGRHFGAQPFGMGHDSWCPVAGRS
jgi:hypothetical protein